MRIEIELTEKDLRQLVQAEIERRAGEIMIPESEIVIQTKSKQNYKAEWETATFRARFSREY